MKIKTREGGISRAQTVYIWGKTCFLKQSLNSYEPWASQCVHATSLILVCSCHFLTLSFFFHNPSFAFWLCHVFSKAEHAWGPELPLSLNLRGIAGTRPEVLWEEKGVLLLGGLSERKHNEIFVNILHWNSKHFNSVLTSNSTWVILPVWDSQVLFFFFNEARIFLWAQYVDTGHFTGLIPKFPSCSMHRVHPPCQSVTPAMPQPLPTTGANPAAATLRAKFPQETKAMTAESIG